MLYSPFYTVACLVPATKNIYGFLTPTPKNTEAVSHPLLFFQTVTKAPLLLPASFLQLQMPHPLPAAPTPLRSLLTPAPTISTNAGAHWSGLGCCPLLALTPALLPPKGLPDPSLCPQL